MKNLLISIVAAFVLCGSLTAASAEPNEKDVVTIRVTNMKTGYKLADISFDAPTKVLRKACNGERDRECLYKVEGKKETYLYDFNPDWAMVVYTYETKIEIARR
jgi:hypothetical protein